ncbi:MAG: helix-turn-helix transcriptional regulator [Treponema sp.]|jgi:transcriptional regulator with XRE-family HTH domain|nr:helix-turn-helix transcriptional regulator [Treponema sp.]
MDDNGIAGRLKEIRTKSGLMQKDFAVSLDTSYSVISDIERGAREPSRQILIALAERYQVDLNWLLLGVRNSEMTSHNQTYNPEVERLENEIADLKKVLRSWIKKIGSFIKNFLTR